MRRGQHLLIMFGVGGERDLSERELRMAEAMGDLAAEMITAMK